LVIGAGLARQASNFVFANFAAQSKQTRCATFVLPKKVTKKRALQYNTIWPCHETRRLQRVLFCLSFFAFPGPVGVGEKRRTLGQRAQRASLTDFARLCERSATGAKRVPRAPQSPSIAADPLRSKGRRLRVAFGLHQLGFTQ
jgi:hypothetical protein